jgi:hypothetical protein
MTRHLLLVALLLAVCGCTQAGEPQSLPVRALEVHLPDRVVTLAVEIADTPEARATGLMHRRELADGKGMLFVWDAPGRRGFWMKNTFMPLDMLFINAGKVVGVVENATPLSETTLGVPADSDMVLEVPGGWVKRHALATGAAVRLAD